MRKRVTAAEAALREEIDEIDSRIYELDIRVREINAKIEAYKEMRRTIILNIEIRADLRTPKGAPK